MKTCDTSDYHRSTAEDGLLGGYAVPGYKQLPAFRTIVVHIDQMILRIQAQRSMETSVAIYHATIPESHRGNRDTVCILGNGVQITYQLGEIQTPKV
jgi:hypothetical protein